MYMKNAIFRTVFILGIVLLLLFAAYALFTKNNTSVKQHTPSQTNKKQNAHTPTLLTEEDKVRVSDIFKLQNQLYNYRLKFKNQLPKNFTELKQAFPKITEPLFDPEGKQYTYELLSNANDYSISTTLSNGTIYTVYGSDFAAISPIDIERIASLKVIELSLKGYYGDFKRYPETLGEILDSQWTIRLQNNQPGIPTDPATGKPYSYSVIKNGSGYRLSSTLDTGIEYILKQ